MTYAGPTPRYAKPAKQEFSSILMMDLARLITVSGQIRKVIAIQVTEDADLASDSPDLNITEGRSLLWMIGKLERR
ncbi:hypothetical protein ECG_08883 [Echinococcus granulosus]|uniref:DNA helicase n=2 Tax=Echinococcus granulosus TaxID=6210 RepID=A0A068WUB4_ECHGR|nr:hypothetical protein ECG_08883 [Echinococcus granulosus]CDS23750.1 hypothetical protein EgrG_000933400.1 [Echinococcus granulosus]